MALSRELHHDEAGIGKMCDLMLYAEDAQSAYNAAWILYYLPAEDKRLYVSPFYDKIADRAMQPCLNIRRGLVLSILIDLSAQQNFRTDLFDFLSCPCCRQKGIGQQSLDDDKTSCKNVPVCSGTGK